MNPLFLLLRRLTGILAIAWLMSAVASAQAPASEPKRSQADLETLLGPIALYPDPLLSIMLPAACYPLEIVEAARFVANTNNIPKIDDQSWDVNVKGVAKIPAALQKLNENLTWTSNLGQAFLDQPKEVMDTIQVLRNRANQVGTLKTTEQQIVIVTNMVVEKTVETKVVVVTNTIVQIEPANPQIVYVPQYVPTAVYYPPPTYNPATPLITFGLGVAVGAIIANNCDWHYGGVYVGGGWGWGYHGGGNYYGGNNNVNININNNNTVINNRPPGQRPPNAQPWKPDTNRLRTTGAPGAAQAYQSREARGWSSGSGSPAATTRPANTATSFPGNNARPTPTTTPANRPTPTAGNLGNSAAARPMPQTEQRTPPTARPATSQHSSHSAFSGVNQGSNARTQANRGAASRGGGGGGGGGRAMGGRR